MITRAYAPQCRMMLFVLRFHELLCLYLRVETETAGAGGDLCGRRQHARRRGVRGTSPHRTPSTVS